VAGYTVGVVGIFGSSAIMEANFAVSEPLPSL
jgi:hypothetical protein